MLVQVVFLSKSFAAWLTLVSSHDCTNNNSNVMFLPFLYLCLLSCLDSRTFFLLINTQTLPSCRALIFFLDFAACGRYSHLVFPLPADGACCWVALRKTQFLSYSLCKLGTHKACNVPNAWHLQEVWESLEPWQSLDSAFPTSLWLQVFLLLVELLLLLPQAVILLVGLRVLQNHCYLFWICGEDGQDIQRYCPPCWLSAENRHKVSSSHGCAIDHFCGKCRHVCDLASELA